MLKDQMGDMERFVAFLRREAAGYNEPPPAPADAMWAAIETGLAADPIVDMGDEELCGVVGYNEPPPAPREAMWAQIESAWVARRPVEQEAREATSGPVRLAAVRGLGRRPRRTVIWLTGAAAASVVLAVGLNRDARLPVTAEPAVVAAAAPESVAETDSGPIAATAAEQALSLAVVEEALESNPQFAAATPPATADPAPGPRSAQADPPALAAVSLPSERPVGSAPRASADEYDMADHFGQAAMLLVAFRTDIGGAESQRDLASWAREVLVETRSLLAAPIGEGEGERALLRDLELILVQIARLGPDAPDFERQLAREGLDQQGTLWRLRSVIGT
ncbi:hypothetical protein [Candidatus Palauibacter sp.]|uniref:hypothetical protein n=1 Tax=Candidatus Palauibacter sp. TaxID=3101350 RepID=UPI003B013E42